MAVNTLNFVAVSFNGYVWKLSADPFRPFLVTEIRNSETRSVDFAAISLETGKILFTIPGKPVESWWAGLLPARDGKFYTHGYRDPKFPGQKGIACYDCENGKLLWKNEELNFYGFSSGKVILAGPGSNEPLYYIADPENGNLLEKVSFETVTALRQESQPDPGNVHLLRYPEESTHFSTVSSFIKARTGHNAVAAVEYAEKEKFLIISYYITEESHMTNFILLTTSDGEIVFHDRTASHLTGTGFDNFLVTKDRLIYVKDKKEVVILSI